MPFKDPARQAQYMREMRARKKMEAAGRVNKVNTVNVNHVNPQACRTSFILSYSRKKYQFVLYSVDQEGRRSLVKSCTKGETIQLGNTRVQLTWGPDTDPIQEAGR